MSQQVNGKDRQSRGIDWGALLAAVPGFGAGLLSVLACPACWTAYAGVLSAIGLGVLLDRTRLLVLTALMFGTAVASFAYRARMRRGYGPALLGTVAVGLTLVGKFALASMPLWYLGIALFVGAALWNAWPRRAARAPSCANCAPREESMRNEARPKEVLS